MILTTLEHIWPTFCPQSLIEYKSQDLPEMMEHLNNRFELKPEDLKIRDIDGSKRLDQESLERAWTQRSEGTPMDIPFWAKGDEVVQQIIRQDTSHSRSTTPYETPLRTPSLLSESGVNSSPSADDLITASVDTSMELEPPGQEPESLDYHTSPLSKVPSRDPRSSHEGVHMQNGRTRKMKKRRLGATRMEIDGRINKGLQRLAKSWKPAMGLRSRRVIKFYELGSNGKLDDYRH